ncbi:uncharacterized protein LOC113285541 [Papaver somniferum]|uniref:uncharacterized protein LOC113285541 n=1 Tax=Papaver somniferum TaxID=3469 RepID=UPI000E705511|nr:uncharacterized protein LOC113285541 [Papaver somniferum]
MSIGETVFLRSYIPGHVPSLFRGSCGVVPYNIDRYARHMGFDQGVPFRRPSKAPDELLPAILDYSVFAPDKSLPFLLPERKPVTTPKYNIFWQDEFISIHQFVQDVVTNLRGKPSSAVLAKHKLLKDLSSGKRKSSSLDADSPQKNEQRSKNRVGGFQSDSTALVTFSSFNTQVLATQISCHTFPWPKDSAS